MAISTGGGPEVESVEVTGTRSADKALDDQQPRDCGGHVLWQLLT
jgi:hypothetical protein